MTYFEVTKENVNELPVIEWNSDRDELFDSVLIVPTDDIHDSGYKCMQFVFCKGYLAVKRVDRGSDVIHIDGIGGYGEWNPVTGFPELVPPKSWSIDCTPNGFLRMFLGFGWYIKPGDGLSDFDIFAVKKEATDDGTIEVS